ncbi:HupE/UreJ family protein [Aliiglaciecola sp. CAU 1673]|uniref:HupE/UreJ family protein n=1 Tax=Aliiglaciecola sp. CAU 1673 TaxID=3032595 RepID=UPI0023D9F9E0|nr:HupE/UreJ family protein [Aliiglaciecola sp. CAU 1673]MDF2179810.1 HupE/UreJ family protein [Aliiglaciecola sp. CAU 1673]
MKYLIPLLIALQLGLANGKALAHTDGVTQARLTFDEDRQFRLELLNFDALNFLAPELAKENLRIEDLPDAPESTLFAILQAGQQRLLQELQLRDQQGDPIAYSLSFPSLETFRTQLQVKTTLQQEPAFLVRLSGHLTDKQQELVVRFPDALNQVALKTVTIARLHIAPGEQTPNLLGQATTQQSWLAVAGRYIQLGFVHIVPKGLDHILFVLGLFLLSQRLKPLIWQISAFTLAHTFTLALSVYGVINLPANIVEPLIALSIVFIAAENLYTSKLHPWRTLVVFAFGLVHGMGFAGVLTELGIPAHQQLSALIAFNLGVELGQLSVVALALLLLHRTYVKGWYRELIAIPASAAIACIGLIWSVQRVVGL